MSTCTARRFGMAALLHEHVEAAHLVPRLAGQRLGGVGVAEVGDVHAGRGGVGLAPLEHLGEPVGSPGDDGDRGAPLGEHRGEGRADARGRAGDEDVGAIDLHGRGTVSDTRVRFRVDLRPMARVGVVGLGNIGGGLATNLVADGHEVTVTDLDPARAKAIEGANAVRVGGGGGGGERDHAHVAAEPDRRCKRWPTSGRPRPRRGRSCSSCPPRCRTATGPSPSSWRPAATTSWRRPLTGGAIGAQNRGLVFMVGGDDEPVSRCLPILEQLGRATFHVGPVGTGTTMKLANSLLAMACTWASFESLSLAAKAGIDLRTAVEVIRTAGVTNFYIDRGVEGINVRGKPAEFTLELAAKDAGLINEIAAATGVPGRDRPGGTVAARRRRGPRPRRPRLDRPRARRRGESRRRAAPAAAEGGGLTWPASPSRTASSPSPTTPPSRRACSAAAARPAARSSTRGASCARGACTRAPTTSSSARAATLYTWTYVHVPLFAKRNAKVDAYGVGQIDLPEGPRVQAILVGGPDDFEIGMELELELEVLGPDKDGNDIVIYRFRPVEPA